MALTVLHLPFVLDSGKSNISHEVLTKYNPNESSFYVLQLFRSGASGTGSRLVKSNEPTTKEKLTVRQGSTSFGACELQRWRWLFGNKMLVSLTVRAFRERAKERERGRESETESTSISNPFRLLSLSRTLSRTHSLSHTH